MPRTAPRIPSYRLHKPTGQGVVTLNGKDHYLGKHGTPQSRAEYDRLIAEWLAHGRAVAPAGAGGLTVNELILAYWRFAEGHYLRDGRPTREMDNIRDAMRPVRQLYGPIAAADFRPSALKAVVQVMADSGLCRNTINFRVGKIRRMFRWGTEAELVPPGVYQALQAVAGLRKGRDGVRETAPVRPVAVEHVEAVLPHVSAPVGAMIQLQLLTGMRPGEVVQMRVGEIDRTGPMWIYRPTRHKTVDQERERTVALGPRAQEVLGSFLKTEPDAHLFSPAVAVEARNERRRRPGKGPASKPRRKPKRPPGDHYSRCAYREAVRRACDKAGVPRFHPNQLRHTCATMVRARYGLEAAQAVLGHAKADVTQVYAERDQARALIVMAEIG
jgi:integrase